MDCSIHQKPVGWSSQVPSVQAWSYKATAMRVGVVSDWPPQSCQAGMGTSTDDPTGTLTGTPAVGAMPKQGIHCHNSPRAVHSRPVEFATSTDARPVAVSVTPAGTAIVVYGDQLLLSGHPGDGPTAVVEAAGTPDWLGVGAPHAARTRAASTPVANHRIPVEPSPACSVERDGGEPRAIGQEATSRSCRCGGTEPGQPSRDTLPARRSGWCRGASNRLHRKASGNVTRSRLVQQPGRSAAPVFLGGADHDPMGVDAQRPIAR
jgi:hypothetical protein